MRSYQPIGKTKDKWTNFDMDYFDDFKRAKSFIERKSPDSVNEYGLERIGLDVFDWKKEVYLDMFWEYTNGTWSRNYKD